MSESRRNGRSDEARRGASRRGCRGHESGEAMQSETVSQTIGRRDSRNDGGLSRFAGVERVERLGKDEVPACRKDVQHVRVSGACLGIMAEAPWIVVDVMVGGHCSYGVMILPNR